MDLGLVHAVATGKLTLEQAKALEAERKAEAAKAATATKAATPAKPKDGGKK